MGAKRHFAVPPMGPGNIPESSFVTLGPEQVQQKLLHTPNELPAENCRYINGDINVEP